MNFPIIDISALFKDDLNAKLNVANQIDAACKASGFFKITNHGIEDLNKLWNETLRFFHTLTPEEKFKLAAKKWNPNSENSYRGYFPSNVNGKEGFDIGNPTLNPNHILVKNKIPLQEPSVWPEESLIPGFKEFMISYYEKMINLARVLLRGFALAIGRDETFFDDVIKMEDSMSTLRLNYYPFGEGFQPIEVASDGTKLGCETHKDGCVITLLFQPEVGGLQVEHDGVWHELEPSNTEFIVNTGLCMSRWANNVYNAANHRVRVSNKERISVPFFVEASPHSLITSSYKGINETNYKPITYLEYITESNKRFKEYQR